MNPGSKKSISTGGVKVAGKSIRDTFALMVNVEFAEGVFGKTKVCVVVTTLF